MTESNIENIYLVRHGQSIANLDISIYKSVADHAVPLSALGKEQASSAGRFLDDYLPTDRPVRIWTSPYRRTRETAACIKKEIDFLRPQLTTREHINLCEQQFGLFDGVPDEELPVRFPLEHAHYALAEQHEGRFWARMPMGESRFDVAVRVHQAFGTFHRDAQRHNIRDIVVVCHGVTMRAFIMQWFHLPYEWFDQEKNPGNCDIYRIVPGHEKLSGYVYRTQHARA